MRTELFLESHLTYCIHFVLALSCFLYMKERLKKAVKKLLLNN